MDAHGDQSLAPRVENGVKVFHLDVSVIKWNILPYEQLMAYAFNHQVRINVTNHPPAPTTFCHTHKEPDRQQALELYGALIIDPKEPSSVPAHDLEYI